MASSRSSSLCRSEVSWPSRYARTALSQKYDPFARPHSGLEFAPAARQVPSHLEDMLAALKERNGQFQNEPTSQVERLEREFNQLRAVTHHAQDPLIRSTPGVDLLSQSAIAKTREGVGLRDLVERELKAQQQESLAGALPTTAERGRTSCSVHHRSQSLAPQSSFAGRGHTGRYAVDHPSPMAKMNDLYKDLEAMDLSLQQARRENVRLMEEKDACVAAHERDVAALENMLKSVMDENEKLKQALSAARGTSPKLAPRGMPGELERSMVSDLIQSGISNIPSTPNSNGSTSTQTPPFEPEAELDVTRSSIDASMVSTPRVGHQ